MLLDAMNGSGRIVLVMTHLGKDGRSMQLRRHAIQLAGQLPDDPDEARAVVDYMRTLIDGFIDGKNGGAQATALRIVDTRASHAPDDAEP